MDQNNNDMNNQPQFDQYGQPQPPQNGFGVNYNQPVQPQPTSGMAVAALVLGIIGIVFFWIPYFNTLPFIGCIIGIVLAVKARKSAPSGVATAGLVLSIIGTVLTAIGFFTCTVCVICSIALYGNEVSNSLNSIDWSQFN